VKLTWKAYAGGHLALGHKPGKRMRAEPETTGCTLVVNLLSHRESRASSNAGRLRFPLDGAACPSAERDPEFLLVLQRIQDELARGGRVYIHCSAGLHRTGMVAYALFRWAGLDHDASLSQIRELRELTATELTHERMELGGRLAAATPSQSPEQGDPHTVN
jgi:hypothetical protein